MVVILDNHTLCLECSKVELGKSGLSPQTDVLVIPWRHLVTEMGTESLFKRLSSSSELPPDVSVHFKINTQGSFPLIIR